MHEKAVYGKQIHLCIKSEKNRLAADGSFCMPKIKTKTERRYTEYGRNKRI